MSFWKQVTLSTSVSSRHCLLFKVWGCQMLKPWVGQETGHGWGCMSWCSAHPNIFYSILFYSTRPTKISKEFYALIFGGPNCPRNTLGPLTHQHSACPQVCENDRSDTIHLLLNREISTRYVAITVLSVCCTVIKVVMMMMVVDHQDTSLLSWRWRQPVVSNIGTHWPDGSVICCCTVVMLLCCILLLLLWICL